MRIRYASDLHLEAFYGKSAEWLFSHTIGEDDWDLQPQTILVLAGDICSKIDQLQDFLKICCERFRFVIYVPGNHEFYGYHMDEWKGEMQVFSMREVENLHVSTSVECFQYDGVRFITSTLWADGGKDLAEQERVNYAMADFRYIRYNNDIFNVRDMMELNKEYASKIKEHLSVQTDMKTVVVTHHLPSRTFISERFMHDSDGGINGGFASNIFDELREDQLPDHWIFGHTHDTINRKVASTWFWCNPFGYRGENRDYIHNFYGSKHFTI